MKTVNDLLCAGIIEEARQKQIAEQNRQRQIAEELHRARWIMGFKGINAWGDEAKH